MVLAGGLAMFGGATTAALAAGDRVPVVGAAVAQGSGPQTQAQVELPARDVTEVVERHELRVVEEALPAAVEPLDGDLVGPDGMTLEDRMAGLLSREAPYSASGHLTVVPGAEPAPHPDRTVRTVRVEVEDGLDVDGQVFARMVMDILNDPRGWGGDGSMSFARTDGSAQIRVVLASPATVDAMCAPLRTRGVYSCGRNGHAAINYTRWVEATEEFDDLTVYRQYVVNHEVGHLLGRKHVGCPGDGMLAPIMQQQSIQVAPCVPNGWPFPDG